MHKLSNHPQSILKNIPSSVNRRLSSISSNKDVSDAAAPTYQEALDRAGYNHKLEFIENVADNDGKKKEKAGRDIL